MVVVGVTNFGFRGGLENVWCSAFVKSTMPYSKQSQTMGHTVMVVCGGVIPRASCGAMTATMRSVTTFVGMPGSRYIRAVVTVVVASVSAWSLMVESVPVIVNAELRWVEPTKNAATWSGTSSAVVASVSSRERIMA